MALSFLPETTVSPAILGTDISASQLDFIQFRSLKRKRRAGELLTVSSEKKSVGASRASLRPSWYHPCPSSPNLFSNMQVWNSNGQPYFEMLELILVSKDVSKRKTATY
jgi:hypothetical protein